MTIFSKVAQSFREEGVKEGRDTTRKLKGCWGVLAKIMAVGFSLFYLYTTYFGHISQETHVGIYVLGTFTLVLMLYKASKKSPENRISLFDGVLILVIFTVIIYFIREFHKLAESFGEPPSIQTIFWVVV